jgi:hypothetical protein
MDNRFLILFFIGKKNFDNFLCDVVAMDAYHILLGRWWQYKINAMHDWRHNIYTFSIKRKFIVLKIRREEETVEGKDKKKLFLSRFMNEEKKKRVDKRRVRRESLNKGSMGLMLNKSLTINSGSVKIKGVSRINF